MLLNLYDHTFMLGLPEKLCQLRNCTEHLLNVQLGYYNNMHKSVVVVGFVLPCCLPVNEL